jgi:cytochrome c oxidase subunit 2
MQAAPIQPTSAEARKGQQIFMTGACVGCHTIAGTPATGRVGPNLTHLASRTTIGAVTIPNRRGYLAGWILDPQHLKPGNHMPGINLTGPELQSLLDYLESLK